MKPPTNVQRPEDQFFYDMQVRKSLIYTATRHFVYARHFYSLPVAELTDLGIEMRYSFYQLLQLTMAKLFVNNRRTQKYNLHQLLRDFQTEPFLQLKIPVDRLQAFIDQLAIFRPTIKGLQMARDEWIAHTDKLGGIAPYHNFFPTSEKLIKCGFELLDTCSQAILNTPVFNTLYTTTIGDLDLCKKINTSAGIPPTVN